MKKLTILIPVIIGAACLLSACGGKSGPGGATADSTATMTAKNKQTALNSIVAVSKHDVDGIIKNCSPDFVDYADGSMKPAKGIDSAKAALKGFLSMFPDVHGDNLVAVAQGDTVAVFGTWTGTFKGAMGKMQPTGKSFKVQDADVFTFNKDGKITSHRSIVPMSSYMEQVGASMK